MPTLIRPNTETVAVAFLGGLPALSPSMVATQLPRDAASWSATGFVTVATVGGTPNMYTPMRNPVCQVDCWAVRPGSNKAPWFQANTLAELIDTGIRAAVGSTWVTMPAQYQPARVTAAWWATEPRRVYDDAGNYARYTANLSLFWTAAS